MITMVFNVSTQRDEELVTKAKAGDQQAFVELWNRYRLVLKRRIRRIVENQHDAEDILQDSVLRAYVKLAGFRGSCTFQTWLTKIAINTSLMHLRKNRRRSYASLNPPAAEGEGVCKWDVPDHSPNPEQTYVARQASVMLSRAVEQLSPPLRQIVKQYHQQENTLIDAADAIGITMPAAKARLFRARKLLLRRLKSDGAYNSERPTARREIEDHRYVVNNVADPHRGKEKGNVR